MNIDSLLARELPENRTTDPHILPIYATSSFAFSDIEQGIGIFKDIESGHVYSRYANPTVDTVARKIALLESHGLGFEADAVMTSSGMSAISTLLLGVLKKGDKVLTQGNLYGGTTELLKGLFGQFGIEPVFADLRELQQVETLLREDAAIRLLYCETPANPTLACVDIQALSSLAHAQGALCAIDNTFSTPYLQQPFAFGVDFIVHSTTKYLNGHGNSIAGVVVGRDRELMRRQVWRAMKLAGTNCSPFEAWLTHNGMKTLALRMERHCANALALARFLARHPAVERVNSPGLETHPDHALASRILAGGYGNMLSFELAGGREAVNAFMRGSGIVFSPSLG
ncbi:MAG TPA: PLP-dependent transferase, partial [Saprospiraceae bacterium]|nr:PLP-dependent transferase [Saprospiraceae bacterium]